MSPTLHRRLNNIQATSDKSTGVSRERDYQPKRASVTPNESHQSTPWRVGIVFTVVLLSCLASLWLWYFIHVHSIETDDGYMGKMRDIAEMTKTLNKLSSMGQTFHGARDRKSRKIEGDASEEYALLRQEFDALLPSNDVSRIKNYVQSLKKNTYTTARPQDMSYDIYNCPDDPPENYPFAWNIMTVLKNWQPNDPTPKEQIYQGLCVFDYELDYAKALKYRDAEVPFVIQNDPRVLRTVERWNQPNYLNKLLGSTQHLVELSKTNKYMYWNQPRKIKATDRAETFVLDDKWEPPTSMIRMQYKDWLHRANTTLNGPDASHFYFRLIGCGKLGRHCDDTPTESLFNEMPFFTHKPGQKNFYIVDPNGQRGIHCRFGMKGIIIANHYDASRNNLVVLGGERRYILSHPSQCKYFDLLPPGHPSARHSAVDWGNPDLDAHPNFQRAQVTELVLQAGDVLYLPTNWFHYIINLDLNIQCNTRSGKSITYDKFISACGFSDMLRGT